MWMYFVCKENKNNQMKTYMKTYASYMQNTSHSLLFHEFTFYLKLCYLFVDSTVLYAIYYNTYIV